MVAGENLPGHHGVDLINRLDRKFTQQAFSVNANPLELFSLRE